ncbi:Ulp1 peptidase [Trifolium repens]|nr:Ulp1 peptidase [Trifolium repens]
MELLKLSKSALEILDSPCFLSDEIIVFYFTYLTSITDSDDVLFIDPSVSDFLANVDDVDVVKASVEPLKFGTKNLIFFPVNDSEHWSLLVYDRKLNMFMHHDSKEGINDMQARKLFETLKDCVVRSANGKENIKSKKKNNNKRSSKLSAPSVSTPPSFEECTTPQQTNGYDCGLFVLAIARAICSKLTHVRAVRRA